MDYGFWICGFGFWGLGFGFLILRLGSWVLGFGFWVLVFVFFPLLFFFFSVCCLVFWLDFADSGFGIRDEGLVIRVCWGSVIKDWCLVVGVDRVQAHDGLHPREAFRH